jgi:hypothetical protein
MAIFTTLIINDRLKERKITTTDEYINSRTKMLFKCHIGHEWSTTPASVLYGKGCKICSIEDKKTPSHIVVDKLAARNITLCEDYINNHTMTKFKCICGNEWENTVINVFSGNGCHVCNPSQKITLLTTDGINQRLAHRGIVMISEYTVSGQRADFECGYGHKWNALVHNVLHTSGCPHCVTHGFKPHKSAYLYIFKRGYYIKYGITNNLDKRIKQHSVHGELSMVFTKYYSSGEMAQQIEKNIKTTFGGSFATREQCPDGFTETLCETKLPELLKLIP